MFSLQKYLLLQAIQSSQFMLYISIDLEENVFDVTTYKQITILRFDDAMI